MIFLIKNEFVHTSGEKTIFDEKSATEPPWARSGMRKCLNWHPWGSGLLDLRDPHPLARTTWHTLAHPCMIFLIPVHGGIVFCTHIHRHIPMSKRFYVTWLRARCHTREAQFDKRAAERRRNLQNGLKISAVKQFSTLSHEAGLDVISRTVPMQCPDNAHLSAHLSAHHSSHLVFVVLL